MPSFHRDGMRLYYAERGDPNGSPIVLLHGLLWSARMMERLAAGLSEYRVLLLDLHGHGRSDKPREPRAYTQWSFALDVVALLDHIGATRAVVGGLSLGANVALAFGQRHPERAAGLIVEMPVLGRGYRFARPAFTALATLYRGGGRALGGLAMVVGRVPLPRRIPELAAFRDVASAHPAVASAVIGGLLSDDYVAEDEETLARMDVPALVIGHRRDPLHVLDDARDLAARLPNARLIETASILEYRYRTADQVAEVRAFLESVPAWR